MLKLYQFDDCMYCERVRQTLARLGLEYEKIEVDYNLEKRPAVVMEKNGGRVPVLDDDGEIIVESGTIVNYLEKKYSAI